MKSDIIGALKELKEAFPEHKDIGKMLKNAKQLREDLRFEVCDTCRDFLHKRDISGSIELICRKSGNRKNSFEYCNEWRSIDAGRSLEQ